MKVYLPRFPKENIEKSTEYLIKQIFQSEGRALILLNNNDELNYLKKRLSSAIPYPIYFEGDEEISTLVSKFQNDEHAVLCSVHLWEGLDIPGRSLENVIIFLCHFLRMTQSLRRKKMGWTIHL